MNPVLNSFRGFAAAATLAATALSGTAAAPAALDVCGKPSDRCSQPEKSFAAHELGFRLPRTLKANAEYKSVPFYAVVIAKKADPSCDGGEFTRAFEQLRRRTQKQFADRKVFADHQCPDMAAVAYIVGVAADKPGAATVPPQAFVAIYAGKTAPEAKKVHAQARRIYPQAALHRMRVSYSRIVQ